MEPTRFDALARQLAHGTSRRQILKGLAGGLLGVAAAPLATRAAPGGNRTCAQFCAATFGADTPAAQQCTRDATKGTGLCYSCGPASPGGAKTLCCTRSAAGFCTSYSGATCPSLTTDVNNCGSCGTVCTTSVANATATCTGGVCGYACAAGYHNCGGRCVSNSSVSSCGASCTPCRNPANGTATCDGTSCGITCNSGYKACNGACIPSGDCCGVCPAGESCQGGTCAPCVAYGGSATATAPCCSGASTSSGICCVPNGNVPVRSLASSCCSGVYDVSTNLCVSCVPSGHSPEPLNAQYCCSGALNGITCA